MKNLLIIFALSSFMVSCKNENKAPVPILEQMIDKPVQEEEQLATVPQFIIDSLLNNTTSVEGTMYNTGSSFALSEKNSAKSFVSLITNQSPSANSKNQVGHLMFLNNGNNLLICSVYMNDKEVFARFDIDGQSYYNILTGQASGMFTNIQVKPKE